MANEKEIRQKIASIQNTQKITKAMEMVAASKMRRAKERMLGSRPYAEKLSKVVEHLATSALQYRHPWLLPKSETKCVGIIVVSTDRGLCGGLNTNIFKVAGEEIAKWNKQNAKIKLCVFGKKGASFYKRLFTFAAASQQLGDKPTLRDVLGPTGAMLDAFSNNEIERLFIVRNRFVNTMKQLPETMQLLPVQLQQLKEDDKNMWDYIYEPNTVELAGIVLRSYVETLVYQAVVENVACEMAARMVSMKSASDNARDMVDELRLSYNKARQAAITQEISEIVGGAAAV